MWNPTTTDLKIVVGGADVTAYVPRGTNARGLPPLSVSQQVGSAIDSCTLGIENGGALSIAEWDEIKITNAAETTTYYGGYVTNIEDGPVGPELDLVLTCQDYGIRFERCRYNGEWKVSTTLASVLATIKAGAMPPLSDFDFATYVQSLGSITRLRSPRLTVRDLLDELASRLAGDWYVDYDKKLHMFADVETFAPYHISDEPNYSTTFPCENLKRYRSGTATVNRVTVVGGAYYSDDVEHEYAGDGQQVRFVVPYHYHESTTNTSVKVYQNAGSDESPSWTQLTVGVKYLDDNVAKDVYYAFEEKFFEFTAAPPNLKRSWKVAGRYEAPLRVVVTNDASYAALGFYLDDIIVDDTIRAKDEARIVGTAYMLEHANTTVLTCATVEPGLRAGQVIRITNGELGLSSTEYLIRNLTMTFPGGGNVRYSLSIGDYVPDLYALLRKLLKRKSNYQYEWREDEVLDVLESWGDGLEMAESYVAPVASTEPYYLSDDPDESMEFGGTGAWYSPIFSETFYDDFETGDFSLWTGTYNSPVVQDVVKYAGTHAAEMDSGGTEQRQFYYLKEVASWGNYHEIDFWIRFPELPDYQQYFFNYLLSYQGNGYRTAIVLGFDTNRYLNFYADVIDEYGSIDDTKDSSSQLSLDTWYHVKFAIDISGSTYSFTWEIDGVAQTGISLNECTGGTGQKDITISFGTWSGQDLHYFVDNVWWSE